MRDIEFRGKRREDNQWVFGNFVNGLFEGWASIIRKADADKGQPFEEQDVDVNTIGQFTGMHDVNGKKIFEGDIVVINTKDNCGNMNGFTGIVVYNITNFELQNIEDMEVYEGLSFYEESDFVVIGNIFDNQGLLEV